MWRALCAAVLLISLVHYTLCLFLLDSEWKTWKTRHGRVYKSSMQEAAKRKVWEDNHHVIQEHNRGNHTFELGLNMFADLVSSAFGDFIMWSEP